MPKRSSAVRDFLLASIPSHPQDIAGYAARRLGISRQAINRHLRALAREGVIEATGATRGRSYRLVQVEARQVYAVDETLAEDRAWREFAAPQLRDLAPNVLNICHHGFTEILNNALDHSEGDWVVVSVIQSAAEVALEVYDDGVGIFKKIMGRFQLENERHAVLELTKGKLTTDPQRHTGEGIFFTSRMFDRFSILSGTLLLEHTASEGDWLLEDREDATGTSVSMKIAKNSDRTAAEVFDQFTSDDEGRYDFDITHVPVALTAYGEENLVSRSQAKRLVARFDRFKKVVLNFTDVHSVGQAFADELFRVFPQEHPDVRLTVINGAPDVLKMIRRVTSSLPNGPSSAT